MELARRGEQCSNDQSCSRTKPSVRVFTAFTGRTSQALIRQYFSSSAARSGPSQQPRASPATSLLWQESATHSGLQIAGCNCTLPNHLHCPLATLSMTSRSQTVTQLLEVFKSILSGDPALHMLDGYPSIDWFKNLGLQMGSRSVAFGSETSVPEDQC